MTVLDKRDLGVESDAKSKARPDSSCKADTSRHVPYQDRSAVRILFLALLVLLAVALIVAPGGRRSPLSFESEENVPAEAEQPVGFARLACAESQGRYPHWFSERCSAREFAKVWVYWAAISSQYPDLAHKLRIHTDAVAEGVTIRISSKAGTTKTIVSSSVDLIVTDLGDESLRQLADMLEEAPGVAERLEREMRFTKARMLRMGKTTPQGLPRIAAVRAVPQVVRSAPTMIVIGSEARVVIDGPQYASTQALSIDTRSRLATISVFSSRGEQRLERIRRYATRSGKLGRPPPPAKMQVVAFGNIGEILVGSPRANSAQSIEIHNEIGRAVRSHRRVSHKGMQLARAIADEYGAAASELNRFEYGKLVKKRRMMIKRRGSRSKHGVSAKVKRGRMGGRRTPFRLPL